MANIFAQFHLLIYFILIEIDSFYCSMSIKVNFPLWKSIGFNNDQQQSQSSIRAPQKPLKGYQIAFDDRESIDDSLSEELIKIRRVESMPANLSINQSGNERASLMLPVGLEDEKQAKQELVLQVISFESEKGKKVLDTIKEQQNSSQMIDRQSESGEREKFRSEPRQQRILMAKYKLKVVLMNVRELRKELSKYRVNMLRILSEWVQKSKKDCKKMSGSIEKTAEELLRSRQLIKESGMKGSEQINVRNNLVQELNSVKASLNEEKGKNMGLKTKLQETQLKLKKYELKKKNNIDQVENDRLQNRQKIESELDDLKMQNEEVTLFTNKCKDIIREREQRNVNKNPENQSFHKQMGDSMILHKEMMKSKQQVLKLRNLLKNSEEQLKQCEAYMTSMGSKIKLQEEEIEKLNNRIKGEQMHYWKKLQCFNKDLIEMEYCLGEMTKNHEHKVQHLHMRQVEVNNLSEQLEWREIQMKKKEYQLEELKNELKHQLVLLQRKQESMKVEYKMAIEAQNATKDIWYERYYQLYSDKLKLSICSTLSRQIDNKSFPTRPSFTKKASYDMSGREKSSLVNQILPKTKSQQYLSMTMSTPRRDEMLTTRKSETTKADSYRDLNISSRINNIRRELAKEFNQIKFN